MVIRETANEGGFGMASEQFFEYQDGVRKFIFGPVALGNGMTVYNVIHTVMDGFAVDWHVQHFARRSLRMLRKYPTSDARRRECGRYVSIPDGTFATLKKMALEVLEEEVKRRSAPLPQGVAPARKDDPQRSLFPT